MRRLWCFMFRTVLVGVSGAGSGVLDAAPLCSEQGLNSLGPAWFLGLKSLKNALHVLLGGFKTSSSCS